MVLYRMYGMNCTVPYGAGIVLCFASKYSMLSFRKYVHSTLCHRRNLFIIATIETKSDSTLGTVPVPYSTVAIALFGTIRPYYHSIIILTLFHNTVIREGYIVKKRKRIFVFGSIIRRL